MFVSNKKLIAAAQAYLPEFLEKYKEELKDRTGAYMFAATLHMSVPASENLIRVDGEGDLLGTLLPEKLDEKKGFASEKVFRLMKRRMTGHPDRTSMVTQNYATKEFGGAVYVIVLPGIELYVAVSGFPPLFDTLFVAELLLREGIIDQAEFDLIMTEAREHEHTGEWK